MLVISSVHLEMSTVVVAFVSGFDWFSIESHYCSHCTIVSLLHLMCADGSATMTRNIAGTQIILLFDHVSVFTLTEL